MLRQRPGSRDGYLNSTAISGASGAVPVWLKLAYGAFVTVLVPVYWWHYGPQNFLWLSDLALFATAIALIAELPWLAGMAAVGVLTLEIAWTIDFLSGGALLDLASYMFDSSKPLYLRGLSLFHLALPPTLLWLLHRLGYDRRSFIRQTLFTLALLPATWLLTAPSENINWVYGPGEEPQRSVPPLLYLALEMAIVPALAFLPAHLLLKRLFAAPRRSA
jgi:hypothetical protein